jgi:hypothetical protein
MTFVFYPNKKCSGLPYCQAHCECCGVPRHAAGIPHDNFGIMTCYKAKRNTAPLHFHTTVQDFLECKCLLGLHMILILNNLVSSSGRYRKDAKSHHCSTLGWNMLKEHKLPQLVTPTMLTNAGIEPTKLQYVPGYSHCPH